MAHYAHVDNLVNSHWVLYEVLRNVLVNRVVKAMGISLLLAEAGSLAFDINASVARIGDARESIGGHRRKQAYTQ